MEYRQRIRSKPTPVLELTPASHRLQAMRQQADNANEKRIKALKTPLNKASDNLKTQYRLSSLKTANKSRVKTEKPLERTR